MPHTVEASARTNRYPKTDHHLFARQIKLSLPSHALPETEISARGARSIGGAYGYNNRAPTLNKSGIEKVRRSWPAKRLTRMLRST